MVLVERTMREDGDNVFVCGRGVVKGESWRVGGRTSECH